MDPDNPIVKLCVDGMKAESEGRIDEARLLFVQAWKQSKNDFDACIAAHYVARHQKTLEETLHWNNEALERAEAVNDERVHGFYPSLYLNFGKAHEDLGNWEQAKRHYELAAAKMSNLPLEGRYGDVVRDGIKRGLQRVG
jgi:tetratricopeptide (TPR) repeat protein